ncbi:related to Trafficking protein particle complex II-specific subunit 120 [Zygosaccharomyces bailii ISA1307]|nr:related to Trafficking protein particle complex II-specific subunit 120 [Zygosaccharomyces bailii ISA1307]
MNPLTYDASFVQPCRVRLLVVPIGKWNRQKFLDAVMKLRKYNEVRLLDITPIDSPLFTPQGFPNGRLFFEIDTSGHHDALNLFLYDFEPFRKIFVVIGLVNDNSEVTTNLKVLKEKFPTVISHNLIYVGEKKTGLENDVHAFYNGLDYELNLETIICDIGRNFLNALSHYYSSYKHVTLRSPGAIGGNSVLKTAFTRQLVGANALVNSSSTSSKRNTFESTTGSIKRSASLKLAKSLSASENKSQVRSQGRQCKILGNFQLLAGRYIDALNSFTEAVTHLYKVRDHLWLASALDGIAICFLLLTFLKVSFQIPSIVMLIVPVQTSSNSMEINSSRSNATPPNKSPRNSSSTLALGQDFDVENVNLPIFIKMISEKILYYYELSLNHHCDYAPQIVYAETLLKTLTFMVACRSSSRLSQPVLEKIIKGTSLKTHEGEVDDNEQDDSSMIPNEQEEVLFTKLEIYSFANKTFELQLKEMEIESQSNVYILLSKVYHSLGFTRKRLFVLRLLLVALLANQDPVSWYSDYQEILDGMVKLYGIEDRKPESSVEDSQAMAWLTLQKKCLHLCLMVARKLKCSESAARYAVMLVSRYTHLLTQSEQQNLFVAYIQPYFQVGYIKSYWDPFLLRDVKLARLESDISGGELPLESEVAVLTDKPNSGTALIHPEEIFNPFRHLLSADKIVAENSPATLQNVFLVGDRAMFSCMVQNPYKFEISITGVQFNSSATKFCELSKNDVSLKRPFYVSPESIRIINLPMELKSPTHHDWLDIDSVQLSVMGMPMGDFPIALSENHIPRAGLPNDRFNAGKVQIKVLPEQPELQLLRTDNMTDNSWMMLHGTKKRFTVTLRNKSLKCPIEYLQFLHATNVEQSVKPDYWKKMQLDDLHGLETQLEWLKNSCIKVLNPPQRMEPNETCFFELEVDASAMPFHFNGFDLVINYGMNANDKSRVYLKRLQSTYNVTLKRSIEVPSIEIVPLNENFASEVSHVDWVHYLLKRQREDSQFDVSKYLLLLLDMRNSWIDSIKIQIQYEDFVSHEHVIETNHTTRVVVPIRKLEYQNYNFKKKLIPRVWQGRQYIQSGLTDEQEIDMREKFWCREHILSRLRCNWTLSTDDSVKGMVNFRQFVEKFDTRMILSLYEAKSPYHIDLSIDKRSVAKGQSLNAVVKVSPTSILDPALQSPPEMLFLSFMIFDNHTARLLTKSDKRVLFNGTLSRCLRVTKPVETALQLLPIEKGSYEICACISRSNTSDQVLQFNPGLVTFTVV